MKSFVNYFSAFFVKLHFLKRDMLHFASFRATGLRLPQGLGMWSEALRRRAAHSGGKENERSHRR
jgi:hypothetical protein